MKFHRTLKDAYLVPMSFVNFLSSIFTLIAYFVMGGYNHLNLYAI